MGGGKSRRGGSQKRNRGLLKRRQKGPAGKTSAAKKDNPFDLASKNPQKNTQTDRRPDNHQPRKWVEMDGRRHEIGDELRNMKRNNQFTDNRVAERDRHLSREEKAWRRFALQRKKLFESRGNVLDAHLPSTDDINVVDTKESSDDSSEEKRHPPVESVPGDNTNRNEWRSRRKEALSNLISQSKREKAIRHMAKEQQLDATEKLDEVFSKLKGGGELRYSKPGARSAPSSNELRAEDYDSLYATLKFEKSADPPPVTARFTPTTAITDKSVPESQEVSEKFAEVQGEKFLSLLEKYRIRSGRIGSKGDFEKLEKLIPLIHSAMLCNVPLAVKSVLSVLQELQKQISDSSKITSKLLLSVLAIIELVDKLFPLNEPLHPVAIPTLALAMQLISSYKVKCAEDCGKAILISAAVIRMVGNTKRYLPEVTAFLSGCLIQCTGEKGPDQFPSSIFPGRHVIGGTEIGKPAEDAVSLFFGFQHHGETTASESDTKASVVNLLIHTTHRYLKLYSQQNSAFVHSLFKPFLELVAKLPVHNYPPRLAFSVSKLQAYIEEKLGSSSSLSQLKLTQHKRVINEPPLLEPRFEESFNPTRPNRKQDSMRDEIQRMGRMLRKETRGAMKKLRVDANLLAQEQAAQDSNVRRERKRKTKMILSSLQQQESEYKKRKLTSKKF